MQASACTLFICWIWIRYNNKCFITVENWFFSSITCILPACCDHVPTMFKKVMRNILPLLENVLHFLFLTLFKKMITCFYKVIFLFSFLLFISDFLLFSFLFWSYFLFFNFLFYFTNTIFFLDFFILFSFSILLYFSTLFFISHFIFFPSLQLFPFLSISLLLTLSFPSPSLLSLIFTCLLLPNLTSPLYFPFSLSAVFLSFPPFLLFVPLFSLTLFLTSLFFSFFLIIFSCLTCCCFIRRIKIPCCWWVAV